MTTTEKPNIYDYYTYSRKCIYISWRGNRQPGQMFSNLYDAKTHILDTYRANTQPEEWEIITPETAIKLTTLINF